jgi:hypothetical protein
VWVIHANIAGNLLEKNWINRASPSTESLRVFLMLSVLLLFIFFLEPISSLAINLILLGSWALASYFAMTKFYFFIPGLPLALASMPIIFAGLACTVATLAMKELRETKRSLGLK